MADREIEGTGMSSLMEPTPQSNIAKVLYENFLHMCRQRKIQYADPKLALERYVVLAGLKLGEANVQETFE